MNQLIGNFSLEQKESTEQSVIVGNDDDGNYYYDTMGLLVESGWVYYVS